MQTPSLVDRELQIVDDMGVSVVAAGKPLLVHTMADANPVTEAMWKHAIPAYPNIETAIRALVDAHRLARAVAAPWPTPRPAPTPSAPAISPPRKC